MFFLVMGRIAIYIFEKFVNQNDIKIKFIKNLAQCLLCSGVWAYSLLAFAFTYSAFPDWKYVQFVSQIITGLFSAVLVFYLENGYKAVHEVLIVG